MTIPVSRFYEALDWWPSYDKLIHLIDWHLMVSAFGNEHVETFTFELQPDFEATLHDLRYVQVEYVRAGWKGVELRWEDQKLVVELSK